MQVRRSRKRKPELGASFSLNISSPMSLADFVAENFEMHHSSPILNPVSQRANIARIHFLAKHIL
jgi:hypothetical protein